MYFLDIALFSNQIPPKQFKLFPHKTSQLPFLSEKIHFLVLNSRKECLEIPDIAVPHDISVCAELLPICLPHQIAKIDVLGLFGCQHLS